MLAQQLRRLEPCQSVDEIVIATTNNTNDDSIVTLTQSLGIRCFRGSEKDVLSRYIGAARECHADLIVRITSDCPLIDAGEVDRVINETVAHQTACDYVANNIDRTFPRGLDTEALFIDVLERMNRLAVSTPAREHVTHFYRERPDLLRIRSIQDTENNADLRWTVDTPEDFAMIEAVYRELDLDHTIRPYRDILKFVRSHPEIIAMNAAIQQKAIQ